MNNIKLLLLACGAGICTLAGAQQRDSTLLNDTTFTLETLTSPTSPGAVLLGVNPGDIQKPTDVTGIMASIRNASNNFTSFPNSFAIDIAPKWLFGGKSITYQDYASGKNAFWQTFTVSYSQVSQDDDYYKGLKQGIGISFSPIRGKITDKKYLAVIDSFHTILRVLNSVNKTSLDTMRKHNSTYQDLSNKRDSIYRALATAQRSGADAATTTALLQAGMRLDDKLEELDNKMMANTKRMADSINSERVAYLTSFKEAIVPVRKGFFVNMATGGIVKYNDFKANASSITNKSVWVNLGYDGIGTDTSGKSFVSVIAMSRLIADNNDELYKSGVDDKYTTWDNGLKVAYTTSDQRFSIGGEALARKLFNVQSGKSFVWKYTVNVDFRVGKNQRLTLSYGKDFENHITKDGNVIGYINFVAGLFNKRSIK
jgi:hypothetical protein